MPIKHLVISGGGHALLQYLGIVQCLDQSGYIKIAEIESIYGTSAGAIVGTFVCLKFDWDTIVDYVIKRPWKDVFNISVHLIFDAFSKKGVYDTSILIKCFKPLFDAKGIALDITMSDFFALTGVELHMYAFDINQYITCDISYLTHPSLSLMTALHMTCAIPVLFSPVCMNDACFVDGGFECNYPLTQCLASGKTNGEILGIKNKYAHTPLNVNTDTSLFDFLINFMCKVLFNASTDSIQPHIDNEVICDTEHINLYNVAMAVTDMDTRKRLHTIGQETGSQYISRITNSLPIDDEIGDNNV